MLLINFGKKSYPLNLYQYTVRIRQNNKNHWKNYTSGPSSLQNINYDSKQCFLHGHLHFRWLLAGVPWDLLKMFIFPTHCRCSPRQSKEGEFVFIHIAYFVTVWHLVFYLLLLVIFYFIPLANVEMGKKYERDFCQK